MRRTTGGSLINGGVLNEKFQHRAPKAFDEKPLGHRHRCKAGLQALA